MTKPADIEKMPDRIAEMFTGKTVFITGGSGFLGKVLIEKLLRCCGGVKKIYILIRNKKGKTPNERIQDIFNNALFDTLRAKNPDAFQKCQAIAGDVTEVDLGISSEDRKTLQEEVEFFYHSAATTRFDDTMKYAVTMNTRGTKFALDLAHQCKKLKCFIHVSTAYVNPLQDVLDEKYYPPPANPYEVLNSINWIKEDAMGNFTKQLLGDIPNTYTFTKALAEALVYDQMEKLPAIVVRPSVVIPIYKDPLPGWCNNLQGPMGLFVGAGKGIIRSMYMDSKSYADMVPADICVNGMLCATWYHVNVEKKQRFFNLTSTSDYQFSWEEIIEMGKKIVYTRMPFNQCVWYPGGSMKKSRIHHAICFYLFQIIPALFIDLLLLILGYKPVLYGIQRRIEKGQEMFEYYTSRAWNFTNDKMKIARDLMNKRERSTYILDGEGLDLMDYFEQCIHTVRLTILKETDDMLPAARRNMKILWALDKICKGLFFYFLFLYTYRGLSALIH
ncbi:putative fatty acyl-CoA reductase CG5065 [Coccinella septempunctata]|uniref:putative fatty acyl-CoA reductase CG5065 n=1 Tax=Coccinella septempunctata TaxID=41139 RepID=UPI001D061F01|nr:putative fatty acyl-CoA reductase CG5065 [Coccinella septempunctata]